MANKCWGNLLHNELTRIVQMWSRTTLCYQRWTSALSTVLPISRIMAGGCQHSGLKWQGPVALAASCLLFNCLQSWYVIPCEYTISLQFSALLHLRLSDNSQCYSTETWVWNRHIRHTIIRNIYTFFLHQCAGACHIYDKQRSPSTRDSVLSNWCSAEFILHRGRGELTSLYIRCEACVVN